VGGNIDASGAANSAISATTTGTGAVTVTLTGTIGSTLAPGTGINATRSAMLPTAMT
jgi:hypothetical protein